MIVCYFIQEIDDAILLKPNSKVQRKSRVEAKATQPLTKSKRARQPSKAKCEVDTAAQRQSVVKASVAAQKGAKKVRQAALDKMLAKLD